VGGGVQHTVGDKIDWLKACQKRREELAAILRIQLKITGSSWWGQKELFWSPPTS